MEPAAAGPPKATNHTTAPTTDAATATAVATPFACQAVGLVAVGLAGAGLLVWWALAFHRANARLWMVPAGLVLLGTPLVAWLSVFASGPCCRGRDREAPTSGAP